MDGAPRAIRSARPSQVDELSPLRVGDMHAWAVRRRRARGVTAHQKLGPRTAPAVRSSGRARFFQRDISGEWLYACGSSSQTVLRLLGRQPGGTSSASRWHAKSIRSRRPRRVSWANIVSGSLRSGAPEVGTSTCGVIAAGISAAGALTGTASPGALEPRDQPLRADRGPGRAPFKRRCALATPACHGGRACSADRRAIGTAPSGSDGLRVMPTQRGRALDVSPPWADRDHRAHCRRSADQSCASLGALQLAMGDERWHRSKSRMARRQ